MSDEVEVPAEVIAPATEATAVPETEVPEPVETPQEAVKTFTQEELDAEIGKRLARERRKFEREQQQRIQEAIAQAVPKPVADPKPENFATVDDYVNWKVQQEIQERERQKHQTEVVDTYREKEELARDKYDDFEQVAYNPNLRITDVMAETIQSSEIGPDLAYFLGTNPKEADRISRLAPIQQAREIGRIEAKLASDPVPFKKTSAAPAPIVPMKPSGTSSPAYDTTDPRSIKSMSTSEWIEADRKRQMKKLEANRIR